MAVTHAGAPGAAPPEGRTHTRSPIRTPIAAPLNQGQQHLASALVQRGLLPQSLPRLGELLDLDLFERQQAAAAVALDPVLELVLVLELEQLLPF
jgi:hypothetical protein